MLMGRLDVLLQQNFFYRSFRRKFIESVVKGHYQGFTGKLKNKTVLEIGCGSGLGTEVIKKYFSPKEIIATDLDPVLIEAARNKVSGETTKFDLADATNLEYESNYFDAVFDFGVMHHIPDWQDCLNELHRVLKKEGKLFILDISIEAFSGVWGTISKTFTIHPYEAMYRKVELVDFLKKLNFQIIINDTHMTYKKYFVIVAVKK